MNYVLQKKKILALIGIILLVIIIPLTVWIAQKQQETRQRASGDTQSELSFRLPGNQTPLQSLPAIKDRQTTVEVYLNTKNTSVTVYDLIFRIDGSIRIDTVSHGADASRFATEVEGRFREADRTIRLSKVVSTTVQPVSGTLHIGSITFTPTQTGTANIITQTTLIGTNVNNQEQTLSINKPTLTVSITEGNAGGTTANASIFFAETGSSTSLSNKTLTPNQNVSVDLYLQSSEVPVYAFNLLMQLGNGLTFVSLTPGRDIVNKFHEDGIPYTPTSFNIIHYSKTAPIPPEGTTEYGFRGTFHIGTLTVSTAGSGNGEITFPSVSINSNAVNTINTNKISLSYSISGSNPTVTLTPTQTPTQTPIPTATGTVAPGATRFNFDLILTGIGPNGGNANPRNQQRDISVGIYSATEMLVKTVRGNINFIQESGTFRGSADVSDITPGNYTLKVTVMDGQNKSMYLTKKMLGVQTITSTGGQIDILPAALTVGDLSHSGQSDNQVDILDFNIFRDCYGDKISNSMSCPNPGIADLDDNGVGGDNTDYQLLINSLSSQHGD